jgi:hypothetical protein
LSGLCRELQVACIFFSNNAQVICEKKSKNLKIQKSEIQKTPKQLIFQMWVSDLGVSDLGICSGLDRILGNFCVT